MNAIITEIRRELSVDRDEAEMIAATLLGRPRFSLYLSGMLDVTTRRHLRLKMQQLKSHVPIEYITQRVQFLDLELVVRPGVFIPRIETEYFVELLRRRPASRTRRILDVGTGTGAIAISLARAFPEARIIATDISDHALACARENLERAGLKNTVLLVQTDILSGIAGEFDLIVSNPPYIPRNRIADLPESVRCYEPLQAIDGGRGGIAFIAAICRHGLPLLAADGVIALEIDEEQPPLINELLATPAHPHWFARDLFGRTRYLFVGEEGHDHGTDRN